MPLSKRHKEQQKKNYTLLFIILGVMALFFVITLIRFSNGAKPSDGSKKEEETLSSKSLTL